MFDDEKIKLLESMPEGDTMIVIWCKLLTMAGKGNHRGYIMLTEQFPYTEDMLITLINRPSATVRMALEVFQRFGMLEFDEDQNAFALPNWSKHQNIEGMDRQKELNKQRQARFREKKNQKELSAPPEDGSTGNNYGEKVDNNVISNVTDNDDITQNNGARKKKGERRKEKEDKEKEEQKNKPSTASVDELKFAELWKSYPKKVDKKKAVAAYTKAIKKGTTHEEIAAGLHHYLKYLGINSWQKPADGGRWFANERWTDEYNLTPPRQNNHRPPASNSVPTHWQDFKPTFD